MIISRVDSATTGFCDSRDIQHKNTDCFLAPSHADTYAERFFITHETDVKQFVDVGMF